MKGWLSTHVLDLSSGSPAGNLQVELKMLKDPMPEILVKTFTNQEGRTDSPLLEGDKFVNGVYELSFYVGDYFKTKVKNLPQELFLDVIPIRFGIDNSNDHYHVPLLVSPYGYSTYRGS